PPQHQQQQQQPINKDTVTKQRIPAIFLPLVTDVVPLMDMLYKHPSVKGFSTKATGGAGRGLRIHCHDLDTYNAVLSVLQQEKLQLHTHQPRQLKGYRVVLKHLHHSTPCDWLRVQLHALGFMTRFVRVMKHRFTSKPLNLFEIELQPQPDGSHEAVLSLKQIGMQATITHRQMQQQIQVKLNKYSKHNKNKYHKYNKHNNNKYRYSKYSKSKLNKLLKQGGSHNIILCQRETLLTVNAPAGSKMKMTTTCSSNNNDDDQLII
ncbi:uncharacterized protein LOC122756858, partial [Drosophila mojavensis]|uniref:uncharacterized protein LOC122756858 n=1 Tax=Drosophila mojavensis TaxID=7230 RepID=UPI001CD170B8